MKPKASIKSSLKFGVEFFSVGIGISLGLPLLLWLVVPGIYYTTAALITSSILGTFAYFACRYDWICDPDLSAGGKA